MAISLNDQDLEEIVKRLRPHLSEGAHNHDGSNSLLIPRQFIRILTSSATSAIIAPTDSPVDGTIRILYDTINYVEWVRANGQWKGTLLQSVFNTFTNGISSYSGATGTQNVAHGIGAIPKKIRITANAVGAGGVFVNSIGTYNGTTTSTSFNDTTAIGTSSTNMISIDQGAGNTYVATVTVNATNIILAWTKAGAPTVVDFMWEAEV